MKTLKNILPGLLLTFGYVLHMHGQCEDDKNYWEESWQSCSTSTNPNESRGESHWILYEFNEEVGLGLTRIWNANRVGESEKGAKEVIIDISKDGISWQQVGTSSFEWDKAPETSDYEGFEGPDLTSYGLLKKVLITVVSTHGDTCASVAEVKFNVNPEACVGQIDECGVCDGPGIFTFYLDADGDGEGNQNIFVQACEIPEIGYVDNSLDICDTGGWVQIGAIFDENGCTGCHNQGATSGLDLTTYEGFVNGGNKCGPAIHTGNTLANIIQIEGYDECGEPISGLSMNSRVGDSLDDLEIAAIQAWIDAGAPEDNACQNKVESFYEDDSQDEPADDGPDNEDEPTDEDEPMDDDEQEEEDNEDMGNEEEESEDAADDDDSEGDENETNDENEDDMGDTEGENNEDEPLDDTNSDSLSEENQEELLPRRVFPNPTIDILNLRGQDSNDLILSAQVFDMGGKRIKTFYNNDNNIESINLESLARGTYLIILTFENPNSDGKNEEIFKIVKE